MGILDDAIREHLELKRRRGADPAEVERAEREALGPVRRNRDPASAESATSAWDEPDEGIATDLAEEYDDDEPLILKRVDEGPSSEQGFYAEQGRIVDPASPGEETTEFSLEDSLAAADAEGAENDAVDYHPEQAGAVHDAEDELEETPEFLQDTPDHDRLWFEQRPPRDFDFDG